MFACFLALDKSRYLCWASRYLLFCALFAILLSAPGAVAAEKTARLLVIGDSLAAGYGLPANEAFTTRLEAALTRSGHRVRVINAGVSGDTSAGGRARNSAEARLGSVANFPEHKLNDATRDRHCAWLTFSGYVWEVSRERWTSWRGYDRKRRQGARWVGVDGAKAWTGVRE